MQSCCINFWGCAQAMLQTIIGYARQPFSVCVFILKSKYNWAIKPYYNNYWITERSRTAWEICGVVSYFVFTDSRKHCWSHRRKSCSVFSRSVQAFVVLHYIRVMCNVFIIGIETESASYKNYSCYTRSVWVPLCSRKMRLLEGCLYVKYINWLMHNSGNVFTITISCVPVCWGNWPKNISQCWSPLLWSRGLTSDACESYLG